MLACKRSDTLRATRCVSMQLSRPPKVLGCGPAARKHTPSSSARAMRTPIVCHQRSRHGPARDTHVQTAALGLRQCAPRGRHTRGGALRTCGRRRWRPGSGASSCRWWRTPGGRSRRPRGTPGWVMMGVLGGVTRGGRQAREAQAGPQLEQPRGGLLGKMRSLAGFWAPAQAIPQSGLGAGSMAPITLVLAASAWWEARSPISWAPCLAWVREGRTGCG